jgi:ABC-type multidrug transport system fused ATPase/permease subunit
MAGPSGGGKSTILKLLLGYYSPTAGSITVDGIAAKDMTLAKLRSLIAYVPQDAYIFDGTVEENIGYGRPGASQEEIIRAAEAAYADEFICHMEQGYKTLVGERGVRLSGGQRQRIAIARAFLKDAPILLLDEATSSLDSQSEQQVQSALERLMKNKTVLIIAHRLSTIESADIIYLIEEGRIIESGPHNILLKNKSLYHRLYEAQFAANSAVNDIIN